MIYYLNLGFIVEQVLMDIVKNYFDRLQLDDLYKSYHISVTNSHPFAHMIIEPNAKAQDHFPSVVITTQSDGKVPEMANVPVDTNFIGISKNDLDALINASTRKKTKINSQGEKEVIKNRAGQDMTEKVPGYLFMYQQDVMTKLKNLCDESETGEIYGLQINTRRRDKISIEIWAENEQLKNEIYEHLRIMLSSSLQYLLDENYKMFHPAIFDNSVNGERSNNFNFDFDVLLYGAHISLDIDYNVSQIIIDSAINEKTSDVVTEVINHVKEQ